MSTLDDLFGALADPTRRNLLEHLMRNGPETATRLAEHSTLTRQAIVKHLQALTEVGLARPERDGREVRYVATPEALAAAVAWLTQSSQAWDKRVDRLRRAVSR